ncbi:hypothetical protein HER14_02530 [Acidithiobacillus thiooxidans]|jgi:hypothetical protein|uniref:hypothetical protein n=1 Tax=Acidithiobacillus thiooxidans TaxID=930 RepID=UPI001C071366|nr:hypothetical protein [Acidithiobacillus thiooxidans]MBU2749872.1 hypothetical protein [Acidithiobacillus thiooxidans]MBU2836869.1 hypothetical protein [Acidithiobacillus thiooxidans]
MTVKSVIDIQIDDTNFKAFLDAFHEFRAETGDVPQDWDKVAESIGGATSKLEGFTEQQQAAAAGADRGFTRLGRSTRQAAQEQHGFAKAARHSSSGLKALAKDAAALDLASLVDPLTAVAAVLGTIAIGAAKATEALDAMTAGKAKNARELGTSVAGMRAFKNYGSQLFSNPENTLAEMNRAKMNPADATGLYALGIKASTISHDTATQLAFAEAKAAHKKLRGISKADRGLYWESVTGGQLGGYGQANLFAGTHMATINHYQSEFDKHKHAYAIDPAAARRAVGVIQGGSEVKSKVKTYVMNAAASKTWTDVAQGAIHTTRAMLNGGETLAHDVESAGASFLGMVEHAGKSLVADVSGHPKSMSNVWWRKIHNPLDIEALQGKPSYYNRGNNTTYTRFGSDADAYREAAQLVRGYGNHTLSGIMAHFEGSAPSASLQAAAMKASGFKMHQRLNLESSQTMAKVITALRVTEQPHARDNAQLYQTIYRAITDGMRSVTIHAHSGATPPGSRVALSAHAAGHG